MLDENPGASPEGEATESWSYRLETSNAIESWSYLTPEMQFISDALMQTVIQQKLAAFVPDQKIRMCSFKG